MIGLGSDKKGCTVQEGRWTKSRAKSTFVLFLGLYCQLCCTVGAQHTSHKFRSIQYLFNSNKGKTLREQFGISRHGKPIKMLHKALPSISFCNDQRINRNFCHKLLVLLRNQTGTCHKLVLGDVPFKIANAKMSSLLNVQTNLIKLLQF